MIHAPDKPTLVIALTIVAAFAVKTWWRVRNAHKRYAPFGERCK
jgi:hypothetical protein